VRGELNRRNMEGCVRAAVLTGDGGDGGTAIEFVEGKRSQCSKRSPVVSRRRESSRAHRSGVWEHRRGDGSKVGGDGGGTLLNGRDGKWLGLRRCRLTVAGSGTRLTRARAADRINR
jgi:hypothetical protein